MDFRKLFIGLVFLVSGTANASIFAPTDNNINILSSTFNSGTILAMFDDSDPFFTGSNLIITPIPADVGVAAGGINPGDFTATNQFAATLNLTGNDWFRLAISTDNGASWSGDISYSPLGPSALNVTFSDGTVLSVDIQVVPVPAAVWLFGSGLLGLVGIARRRS